MTTLPETLLHTQIEALRTLVGPEPFDQADPGMTLRPATTNLEPTLTPMLEPPAADAPNAQLDATVIQSGAVSASSAPGNTFATDYALKLRVGGGGMGDIFLAWQNALRREVAIKKIKPDQLKPEKAQQMEAAFISEGLVTGFLDHPNIVPVHGMGRDGAGQCYFSMKLVRGIEWRQLLHPNCCKDDESKAKALARNLDIDDPARRAAHLAENLRILVTVCNAVAFAHSKNIIHRDLKPENVMVGAFGEVLAMDWGLAVDVSETPPPPGHTDRRAPPRTSSDFGGTPVYMAPEQVPFDENGQTHGLTLGCWTDVFLLGGMLYELLAGHPPHLGGDVKFSLVKIAQCTPAPLPENAPKELAIICRKALSKNPLERYLDALAFQKAVQEFVIHYEAAQIAAAAEFANLPLAVVLYGQALNLWPGNQAITEQYHAAKEKLAIRDRRARWMKRSLFAAAAAIVLGSTIGFFWIPKVSLKLKETSAALDLYKKGLIVSEQLAATDSDNRKAQLEISWETLEILKKDLTVRERLAAENPKNAKAQRDLSFFYNNLGAMSQLLGQRMAALEYYEKGLAIRERLAAADPENGKERVDVCLLQAQLGLLHSKFISDREAIVLFDKCLATADALIRERKFRGEVNFLIPIITEKRDACKKALAEQGK